MSVSFVIGSIENRSMRQMQIVERANRDSKQKRVTRTEEGKCVWSTFGLLALSCNKNNNSDSDSDGDSYSRVFLGRI